jgi:site-specific recombinase XerD
VSTELAFALPQGWITPGRAVAGAAIDAGDDLEAVSTWLRAKGNRSENTFAAYRREALRLLLWLGEERRTLAELKVEDAHRFFAHLARPPAHWIRPVKPRKDEVLLPTQVMTGPLSNRSIAYARTVLGQMCGYLHAAGWLPANVFSLSAKPPVISETVPTRFLDRDAWMWLWEWITALPCDKSRDGAQATRFRWLMALLYHSGLRREEVAHATMGDFVRRNRIWSLRVVGKGQKERFVTMNSTLMRELVRYREAIRLVGYPIPSETMPLVASVNTENPDRRVRPMTPRTIGALVATLGERAAADCSDEHIRQQIARMSTHWMRHTNATHRLMAGATLPTTQDELGHADLRTTRIYAQVSDEQRKTDAEKIASRDP